MIGALSSRRRTAPFNPSTDADVLAWFDVSAATSDANGVSAVPDTRGGASLLQSVNAQKPALGSTANALPMLTCTDDVMTLALGGVHNNTTQKAVSLWLRPANLSGAKTVHAIALTAGGADLNAFEFAVANNDLRSRIWADASNVRQAQTARAAVSLGWQFVSVVLNLATGGAEASRHSFRREAAPMPTPQTTVYSDSQGTVGGTPAALRVATGNILWFANTA